jgi:hypothetical protein
MGVEDGAQAANVRVGMIWMVLARATKELMAGLAQVFGMLLRV